MNDALLNRARRELSGNVMTETRTLTQDERLILWGVKWNMKLLERAK